MIWRLPFPLFRFVSVNILSKTLLAAGAVVALSSMQKAAASRNLNFFPSDIKRIRFEGIVPILTLGITIQNPNNVRMVIRSMVGNISANGIMVGNISTYRDTAINARSQAVMFLDVRLSLIGVVNDIVKAFKPGGIQQTVVIDAWVNVDNITVPMKMTYKVP